MPDLPGSPGHLLLLLQWFSPAFPIGAFGFSHGLETAVAHGRLATADAVEDWVALLLAAGSGWNDLLLFAEAHRGAETRAETRLAELAELGTALAGSRERREETHALGTAFAKAADPWRDDEFRAWLPVLPDPLPYPVAAGIFCGAAAIPASAALLAFAQSFAANIVSAATRLVPLGQGDAVAILRHLGPRITQAAARAGTAGLDALGSAALLSEIAALRHETLRTRLFRS